MEFRFAMCQTMVGTDKGHNLSQAREAIEDAVGRLGAEVVCLPEMFVCPYSTSVFADYSECLLSGPSFAMLSEVSRRCGVYVIGGSIPERQGDHIYNTCMAFSPTGELAATHRKCHLFDINVPGGITFRESETLTAGNAFTVLDTKWCKIGIGICYDMRFSELSRIYSYHYDCKMLCFPGAFNMTTGPAHWELLLRSRALDNQCYVAGVSPAQNPESAYKAWGHSMLVSPWGEVIVQAKMEKTTLVSKIDLSRVDSVRQSIPTRIQRRLDMYTFPSPKL
ncbi:omega-amidase NIT2 [Pelomyxa schiedti]|nr:omega-amidase NIT2 [Pelomyxa schiedti]